MDLPQPCKPNLAKVPSCFYKDTSRTKRNRSLGRKNRLPIGKCNCFSDCPRTLLGITQGPKLSNLLNFPSPQVPQFSENPSYMPITTSTQDQYMSLFTTMQANMDAMRLQMETDHTNTTSHNHGQSQGRERGRGGHFQGIVRGSQAIARPHCGGSYCHTYGNCAHTSGKCKTPVTNHQLAATFANIMGGSITNCD